MGGTKKKLQLRFIIKMIAVVLGLVLVIGVVRSSFKYEIEFGWYRLRAGLGNADAQKELAYRYTWGDEDVAEALKWYKKAAEGGSTEAMTELGRIYEGFGGQTMVPQNYAEAYKWYLMAAELGDSDAMYMLAKAYEEGHGTPKNILEAAKWHYKAALLGDSLSAIKLAQYAKRSADYAQSYVWYSISVSTSTNDVGKTMGKEGLWEVREKLTPEDLAQAQQRASEIYEQILGSK